MSALEIAGVEVSGLGDGTLYSCSRHTATPRPGDTLILVLPTPLARLPEGHEGPTAPLDWRRHGISGATTVHSKRIDPEAGTLAAWSAYGEAVRLAALYGGEVRVFHPLREESPS
jgi:hypothetical protein